MQITDKVFVVTGGGNGIGREVVLALLARGGRVAAVDLSRDGLDETAELATTASTDRLSTHVVDLTDRAAVEALPDAVREAHGRIDGLVNVAGIIQPFVKFADLEYPPDGEGARGQPVGRHPHLQGVPAPPAWPVARPASSTSRAWVPSRPSPARRCTARARPR